MTIPVQHLNPEQAKALHALAGFSDLVTDIRVAAALNYLRANFPKKSGASGEEWQGWFGAVDALEYLLRNPPTAKPDSERQKSAPYTNPEPKAK